MRNFTCHREAIPDDFFHQMTPKKYFDYPVKWIFLIQRLQEQQLVEN